MIKNYKSYKDLALRSIKPHDSKELAILDWTLGLGGESGELLELMETGASKMEWAKEIGDVLWYATALAEELELDYEMDFEAESLTVLPVEDTLMALSIVVGRIQEAIKHYIFHKERSAVDKVKTSLVDLETLLTAACEALNITLRDCASLNAAKLSHRFGLYAGGEYNHEDSAKRHQAEAKFEDTATYKRLLRSITGASVTIVPTDLEVL